MGKETSGDVVVTPDNPLIITGRGPFDYNEVEIRGGQIDIKTNAEIKMKVVVKEST